MAFKKDDSRTCYLFDTHVENLFICEYMPDAPGDYVKVYLYALMEAERGQELDLEDLARELRLSKEDVEKAFLYFEEAGAIKREGATKSSCLSRKNSTVPSALPQRPLLMTRTVKF